eukprot:TRINITY_DN3361_c0_g1_i5.p1 TRINITY_DN3361_c0_g1~~TRINITY_DN3361_c0_g1_i5.p1  ORF type:complete len:1279 (-),score=240.84 TRINITY_DN3361_c0_g1_i5:95-3613(-)
MPLSPRLPQESQNTHAQGSSKVSFSDPQSSITSEAQPRSYPGGVGLALPEYEVVNRRKSKIGDDVATHLNQPITSIEDDDLCIKAAIEDAIDEIIPHDDDDDESDGEPLSILIADFFKKLIKKGDDASGMTYHVKFQRKYRKVSHNFKIDVKNLIYYFREIERTTKDKELWVFLIFLTFFLTFVSLLIPVTKSYAAMTSIFERPGDNEFYEITTLADVVDFVHESLTDGFVLHRNRDYSSNIIVGAVRIRQIRMKGFPCPAKPSFTCYNYFSLEDEEKEDICDVDVVACRYTSGLRKMKPSAEYLKRPIRQAGSRGGYVFDLDSRKDNFEEDLEFMANVTWFSKATRIVSIEYAFFNLNTNLLIPIQVLFEITPMDYVIPSISSNAMVPLAENFHQEYYEALILFYLTCIYTIGFFILEIHELRKGGIKSYKSDKWNIADLLVATLLGVACYNVRYLFKLSHKYKDDILNIPGDEYLDLQPLRIYFDNVKDLVSMIIFLLFSKIFKFLSTNEKLNILGRTLEKAMFSIIAFLVTFMLIFAAFSMAGFYIYGDEIDNFRSFGSSFVTCFRMLYGDIDGDNMLRVNPSLGPLFIVLFVILIMIMLTNIFVAIFTKYYDSEDGPTTVAKNGNYDIVTRFFRTWHGRTSLVDMRGIILKPNSKVRLVFNSAGLNEASSPTLQNLQIESDPAKIQYQSGASLLSSPNQSPTKRASKPKNINMYNTSIRPKLFKSLIQYSETISLHPADNSVSERVRLKKTNTPGTSEQTSSPEKGDPSRDLVYSIKGLLVDTHFDCVMKFTLPWTITLKYLMDSFMTYLRKLFRKQHISFLTNEELESIFFRFFRGQLDELDPSRQHKGEADKLRQDKDTNPNESLASKKEGPYVRLDELQFMFLEYLLKKGTLENIDYEEVLEQIYILFGTVPKSLKIKMNWDEDVKYWEPRLFNFDSMDLDQDKKASEARDTVARELYHLRKFKKQTEGAKEEKQEFTFQQKSHPERYDDLDASEKTRHTAEVERALKMAKLFGYTICGAKNIKYQDTSQLVCSSGGYEKIVEEAINLDEDEEELVTIMAELNHLREVKNSLGTSKSMSTLTHASLASETPKDMGRVPRPFYMLDKEEQEEKIGEMLQLVQTIEACGYQLVIQKNTISRRISQKFQDWKHSLFPSTKVANADVAN